MNDIPLTIKIKINSCTEIFVVILQQTKTIFKDENDENKFDIDFDYYPTLIPLYIYKKNSEGIFNLKSINNNNITDDTNTNIFVTPYDISKKINPFQRIKDDIEFTLGENNKDNIFYEINNEGELILNQSNKSTYKYKSDKKNAGFFGGQEFYHYPTITFPIIGVYKGIWYPTIKEFILPDKDIKCELYKYKEYSVNAHKFVEVVSYNNLMPSYTFRVISELLCNEKVFNNIEKILEKLPDEFKNNIYKYIDLKPISEEINKEAEGNLDNLYVRKPNLFNKTIFELFKEQNENALTILKNNIIIAFWKTLKDRYYELERNGYRDFILLEKNDKIEFENKVNDMRNKYFCKNKDPEIPDNFGLNDELFIINEYITSFEKDKKKYLKQYENDHFPVIKLTHYNNKYIFEKYSSDELSKIDSNVIAQDEKIKATSSMLLTSNINLPELERPEKDLTLNKLINFYNDAIKSTRILPLYIRSALKNKDENKILKAKENFGLLLNAYKAFKSEIKNSFKDTSFLCKYVNDFIFSFEKMVSKLKKAGLTIMGLSFDSDEHEENSNEILKIPEYIN